MCHRFKNSDRIFTDMSPNKKKLEMVIHKNVVVIIHMC